MRRQSSQDSLASDHTAIFVSPPRNADALSADSRNSDFLLERNEAGLVEELVNSPLQPAGSPIVYNSLFVQYGSRLIDFSRFFLIILSLTGEWLHQLFVQLEQYHSAPSKEIQQTWLGFPLIGSAAVSSVAALALNHRHANKNNGEYAAYEDYIFKLFSSSFLFFVLDTISKTTNMGPMPLSWFIAMSAIGLPMMATLFFKLASPESNDRFICPWSPEYNPQHFPDASRTERRLDAVKCVKAAFFSINTLLWAANREIRGQTEPLERWQLVSMSLFLVVAGKIGYESALHPKFFHGYSAFLRFLEMGALIYSALSGIFYMMVVYQCPDRKFCASEGTKDILSYVCALLSLLLGLYTAASMQVRFRDDHEVNQKIIVACESAANFVREKKEVISTSCGSAFERVSLAGCKAKFWSCVESVRSTLAATGVQDENSSLLPPVVAPAN